MKKILILPFLFLIIKSFGQAGTPPNYIKLNVRYDFLEGKFSKTVHIPAGGTTPTLYGGWNGAGALYWDSVGKKLRIWDGTYFRQYTDSIYKLTDSTIVVRSGSQLDTLKINGHATGGGGAPAFTWDDSAYSKRTTRYDPANLIPRIVNSSLQDTLTARRQGGFREFDIIPASDGTQDYEMFYTNNLAGTRYVRFTNPQGLQSALGGANDIAIQTGYVYPSCIKLNGRYYMTAMKNSPPNKGTWLFEASTPAGLASAIPTILQGVDTNALDFSMRPNPYGGFMAAGNISSPGITQIWTAPTPRGPWTNQGNPFSLWSSTGTSPPSYAYSQADQFLFSKGKRIYLMFNGLSATHLGTPKWLDGSHECVIELDPVTWKAKGIPVEMFHPYDKSYFKVFNSPDSVQAAANPVYVEMQGREEIWTMWSKAAPDSGWIARFEVSKNDSLRGVGNGANEVVRVMPGFREDVASNSLHYFYGANIANRDSGIVTTGTNSGLWNFIAYPSLSEFKLHVTYKLSSLPPGGDSATVFHIYSYGKGTASPQNTELIYTVNNSGVARLKYVNNAGTPTVMTITGTISTGVKNEFDVVGSFFNQSFNINNGSQTFATNSTLGETGLYSLFNDSTDVIAPAHQMTGTIYSFSIEQLPYPIVSPGLNPPNNGQILWTSTQNKYGFSWSPDYKIDSTNKYLNLNAQNNFSSTTLNPGVSWFKSATALYSMHILNKNSRAQLGIITPSDAAVEFFSHAAGSFPANQAALTTRFTFLGVGRMGIGVTSPTAMLHLPAGTTAASSAPLKFSSGTNMTTAETGAVEYDGTNLMFTRTGTTRENIVTDVQTQTLTNKRITVRNDAQTTSSSYTPNSDNFDIISFSALAANLTINAPSGTPTEGQMLLFRILDNGTGRTLTWNAAFVAGATLPLPSSTTASKYLYIQFMWSGTASKWHLLSVQEI